MSPLPFVHFVYVNRKRETKVSIYLSIMNLEDFQHSNNMKIEHQVWENELTMVA